MLHSFTRWIAAQKGLDSWTWRKCKTCAYLVAMILWVIVIIPMVIYG